jgi:putative ABC transport system permease protein
MEIRPILSAMLRNKTGAVLVAVQVALSLAILANALHIVSVRQEAAARPSGIADEGTVFSISSTPTKTPSHNDALALQQRELAALRGVPGVVSAADTNQFPIGRSGWMTSVSLTREQEQGNAVVSNYFTSQSLIKHWGMTLLQGRDFTPADVQVDDPDVEGSSPDKVIITKTLADILFPDTPNVVGKTIYYGTGPKADSTRIIGVVDRLQSIGGEPGQKGELALIQPKQTTGASTEYSVRTEPGQRDRVMREAESAIRKVNSGPTVIRTRTFDDMRNDRYRSDRALSWMLIAVSVLLLMITASGIVGIASLWVTQRRKQIGVRRALGARRVDIMRYFLTENWMITTLGIVAGILLALALNQLLVSKLELARLPVGYLVSGCALFWVLGLVAVAGPAWRAASISPATATRGTT